MDDPFGDPFGEQPAPVKKVVPKKSAPAPTPAAAQPAAKAKPLIHDPFADDDFAAPAGSSSSAAAAYVSAAPAAKPVAPASAVSAAKPVAAQAPAPAPVPAASSSSAASASASASASAAMTPPSSSTPEPEPAAAARVERPKFVDPFANFEDPFASAKAIAADPSQQDSKHDSKPATPRVRTPEPADDEPVAAAAASASHTASSDGAEEANGRDDSVSASTDGGVAEAAAAVAATVLEEYVADEDDAEDELTLVDQSLHAMPAELIRTKGTILRRIDLSQNQLSSVASLSWPYGAPSWPALQELILDKNQLQSLAGLGPGPLPQLRTLWLNNNAVEDLELLLGELEKLAPNLTYLSMMRNPAAPESYFADAHGLSSPGSGSGSTGGADGGGMESYHRFRLYVCYRLKKLEFLDSTPVTSEERKEATVRGAYCRVAKPKAAKGVSGSSAAASSSTSGAGSPLSPDSATRQSQVGLVKDAKPPKVATFLAKGKPRYDGTNSEGNRFIMNEDL